PFFGDYKSQFALFGVLALLGWLLGRRHRGQLAACAALISSVVFLYMTMWKETEVVSALRYMLQAMAAWIVAFTATRKRTVGYLLTHGASVRCKSLRAGASLRHPETDQ